MFGSIDECLEYLEKAKRCYEEKRDFLGLGCCSLKEAELRKDDAENHSRLVMRARDFFKRHQQCHNLSSQTQSTVPLP